MMFFLDQMRAEPSLDDVLDDPIVRLLMRCDGIGETEVRDLIENVRSRLTLAAEPLGAEQIPARSAA